MDRTFRRGGGRRKRFNRKQRRGRGYRTWRSRLQPGRNETARGWAEGQRAIVTCCTGAGATATCSTGAGPRAVIPATTADG